jgi:hypothetical protein
VSDVFALGIHRNDENNNIPFFLSEIHKRFLAGIYRADKSLAIFLNRPPRIPRHYCDLRFPLDISDEDYLCEGTELQGVLSRLDANGWNTDGQRRQTTSIRIRYQFSIHREEILELISRPFSEEVRTGLYDVLEELPKSWSAIPNDLKYNVSCWNDASSWPSCYECLVLMSCFLEYRYGEFLIRRHLNKQLQTSERKELIRVSMEILSTVLILIKKRNINGMEHSFFRDFPWYICFYGLPTGGVLATELRNCTLSGTQLEPSISRSELIRNLSLLITSIEWIDEPSHRYYNLCKDAHVMLIAILDETLNYQPGVMDNLGVTGSSQQPMMTVDPTTQLDGENFLAWLDSIDWNSSYPTL